MRILINSYACCPNGGSEPGMGWNWIIALAKYCECYIITEGEFRPQVEQWLSLAENEAIASRLHFYWLPIGEKNAAKSTRIRTMCWNQGDWRFYYYYRLWQKHAANCARTIIENQKMIGKPILLLHQLNMIGFREPGYLWQVSRQAKIPLVWGPINSKEGFPMAYAKAADFRQKLFLCLKNTITRVQLALSPRVRCMAKTSNVIIAASTDAQQSIEKYWHRSSICINETGCPAPCNEIQRAQDESEAHKERFDILWCGRFLFSKQLDLAIQAVAEANVSNIVLHVLGSGNNEPYLQLANKLGVHVVWYGQVSHEEVQEVMQKMDVLLFTSVFEGTPHVVLEAIANQLPVLCHNSCGQGDVVNDKVGITVPILTPKDSIKSFATAINYLSSHPDVLKEMKINCLFRANELTWDKKAMQMLDVYKKCCNE